MHITAHIAVLALACLCLTDGAPDSRLSRKSQRPTRGFKNVEMMTARGFGKRDRPSTRTARDVSHQQPPQRTERGVPTIFKSPNVGIGRDFGKRMPELEPGDQNNDIERMKYQPKSSLMVASDFGKKSLNNYDEVYGTDNLWELLESSPEKDGQDNSEDKVFESIPMDWFVSEMLNNPEFTRSVIRKFIDLNQDGVLSSEELLRNVA